MKRFKQVRDFSLGCALLLSVLTANAVRLGDAVDSKTGRSKLSCLSQDSMLNANMGPVFSLGKIKFIKDETQLKNVLGVLDLDTSSYKYTDWRIMADRADANNSNPDLYFYFYYQAGKPMSLPSGAELRLAVQQNLGATRFFRSCYDKYVSSVDGVIIVLQEYRVGPFASTSSKKSFMEKVLADFNQAPDNSFALLNVINANDNRLKITLKFKTYGGNPSDFITQLQQAFGISPNKPVELDCSTPSACESSKMVMEKSDTFVKSYVDKNIETIDPNQLFYTNIKLSPYSAVTQ